MSNARREIPGTSRSSVTGVARGRHAHVGGLAVLVAASVMAMSAACSDGAGAEAISEGGVSSSSSGDAAPAKDGAADSPVDPAEMLCELAGPPAKTPGDTLVFSDEFDGTAIDTSKWNVAEGYKGHDDILNTTSPDNVIVRDGLLSIRTARNLGDPSHPYVSGYVDTLSKYARTYGRVDFRARFPRADGIWYALWGRPWWEAFPEIDIELVNAPKVGHSQLYFVNHWAAPPLPADERRSYVMLEKEIDYTAFHEYSVLWKPGRLEWLVDGVSKMVAPAKGVPTKPVYWIVNAWAGGWIGDPTDETPLPVSFELDYIRIYRVDGEIADPEIKVISPKATYSRQQNVYVVTANFDEACSHVSLYDGATLVRKTAQRPYRFPMAKLAPGPHELSFVATDGVRSTTTKMTVEIE